MVKLSSPLDASASPRTADDDAERRDADEEAEPACATTALKFRSVVRRHSDDGSSSRGDFAAADRVSPSTTCTLDTATQAKVMKARHSFRLHVLTPTPIGAKQFRRYCKDSIHAPSSPEE